jgi:hypothetical protein
MKQIIVIIVMSFSVSLFAPVSNSVFKDKPDAVSDLITQNIMDNQDQTPDEFGEDEDSLFYDQAIISRKLFQITVPPLTSKQKIIWAYRMSESDLFL